MNEKNRDQNLKKNKSKKTIKILDALDDDEKGNFQMFSFVLNMQTE